MERGRGQLVEDGEEKGPEQPEGKVEDEPDDDDGEEPGGRGRGVAVLGGVRAEARAVWRWDGLKSKLPGWPASFSRVSF